MSKQPSTGEWLAHTKGLLAAAEDIFATAELNDASTADIRVLGITLVARYPALGKAAAARIPHAQVEFPDLGHAPQIQAPDVFHKALLGGMRALAE